jgi:hypothetical protein
MPDELTMTVEQAKDVQLNKENPLHERYRANDKDVVARVSRAFEKSHPGDYSLNDFVVPDVPVKPLAGEVDVVVPRPAEAPAEQPLDPQVKATLQVCEQNLRNDQEFGGNYQANIDAAKAAALDLFGTVENLDAFVERTGIDRDPQLQAEGVRFLAKLAKRKNLKW